MFAKTVDKYNTMEQKKRVLMICQGNSCRSPIAEAVFRDQVIKMGVSDMWEVDSAGLLAYFVGKSPDSRAITTLQKGNIFDYTHTARQIVKNDFYEFDWIFGMDIGIIEELYEIRPEDSQAKIELLGKYDPNGEMIIQDPYFDENSAGFEKAFEQVVRSITSFLTIHGN